MPAVHSYVLPPTKRIPNSPHPLLHYEGQLVDKNETCNPAAVNELFAQNGWEAQWIYRYGPTQASHYHSSAHECMAVLCGSATIRFGVADNEDGPEEGGIELQAHAGDVFLIPAGVSHKTFDPSPDSTFKLMTPGEGHGIATRQGESASDALSKIQLSGFCMIGAYPPDAKWDFSKGGEHVGEFEKVWSVPKPGLDPVLGTGEDGIARLWK